MSTVEKLVREQQKQFDKAKGLGYHDRQPFALAAQNAEDTLNDTLAGGGVTGFLEFMKKYAVEPTGAGHMREILFGAPTTHIDKITGESHTVQAKGIVVDVDASAQSVLHPTVTFGEFAAATKKIGQATLRKSTDAGGKYRLTVDTVANAHSFPIYYLPWDSNKVLRMTIPQRGTTGIVDPDIFFTAGINGCSVFIEGTQDSPTVYHAGTEDKLGGINSGKYWRDLFREYSPTAVNQPKGAKTFGEVKKSQYVSGEGKEIDPSLQTTTSTGVAYRTWLAGNQKDVDVTLVQPWGCVFGLRDNAGLWTFYLQKNAVVKYYSFKKSGFLGTGSRQRGAVERSFNVPMQLIQIFPGHAHAVISAFAKVREGV